MVIVTKNQYLIAHKIHHVTMDELVEYNDVKNNQGRSVSIRDVRYVINIVYCPEPSASTSSNHRFDEQRECSVTIRKAVDAHNIFKNLIQQIREQMPDQLYLDTALERMLAGTDIEKLIRTDEDDLKDKLIGVRAMLRKRNAKIKRSLKKTKKKTP